MIKTTLHIFILLLTFTSLHANTAEQRISLNGNWDFRADYYNQGEASRWFNSNLKTENWDKMPVPGNWDLRNEYNQHMGKAWYRRTFDTPLNSEGKVVRLFFEAVGIDYKVWLNNELISDITGGYFPEYTDISAKLQKDGKNTLTVCVDNTFRSGAYWSWGGIRRPVELIINNPVYIESARITAIPDLEKNTANVAANVNIQNSTSDNQKCILEYELHYSGKTLRKGKQTITLTGSKYQQFDFSLQVKKNELKLWHFDFPHLYHLTVRLTADNQPAHEIKERFGIRKIEVRDQKFLLNGEEIRAMGLNWVADDRLTGNTLPPEVFKRDIDNMKMLGANLSRLSHVPLPKDVYDYLDEKGMLVIAEIPLWGITNLADPNHPLPFTWLKKMVNSAYNHPSIIGWCVGNEIGFVHQNPRVSEYVEKSVKFVKDSLDNSRLAVMVSHSASVQSTDPSRFGDFVPQNSYSRWGWDLDRIRRFQPDKPIFMAEYGQNLIGENLKTSSDFAMMLNEIRSRDYVFGASLWTYNDYRSFHRSRNPKWETKVSQNRDWGVVDAYGNKKRAFEQIRKEHAPFESMKVNPAEKTFRVVLTPRKKTDLPAFRLRAYRLLCEELNAANEWVKQTEITLPDIYPGDPSIERFIPLKKNAVAFRISVISPVGYAQMDTVIHYQAPKKPIIRGIYNNGEKIRVMFDHVAGATSYKLIYGEGSIETSTNETTDFYIDTEKLSQQSTIGKNFFVKLVAINAIGETASEVTNQTILSSGVFPPVVKAYRSYMGGLSIGYSSDPNEYLYKIQYSTSPDFSTDTHIIQTSAKGACLVPNLQSGVWYYFRMCSVHQYEQQSEWGVTYSVVI